MLHVAARSESFAQRVKPVCMQLVWSQSCWNMLVWVHPVGNCCVGSVLPQVQHRVKQKKQKLCTEHHDHKILLSTGSNCLWCGSNESHLLAGKNPCNLRRDKSLQQPPCRSALKLQVTSAQLISTWPLPADSCCKHSLLQKICCFFWHGVWHGVSLSKKASCEIGRLQARGQRQGNFHLSTHQRFEKDMVFNALSTVPYYCSQNKEFACDEPAPTHGPIS